MGGGGGGAGGGGGGFGGGGGEMGGGMMGMMGGMGGMMGGGGGQTAPMVSPLTQIHYTSPSNYAGMQPTGFAPPYQPSQPPMDMSSMSGQGNSTLMQLIQFLRANPQIAQGLLGMGQQGGSMQQSGGVMYG